MAHIGVRSIYAGVLSLAIGVALDSVCRHVAGPAGAVLRAESAGFSGFETIRPKRPDDRAPLVRVASLEAGFVFESAVQEVGPPASTSSDASFGERFLFDRKLASFDERFLGADISVAEVEGGTSDVLNYARPPSHDPGEHASQSVTGRSTPKLAPTALPPPASPVRKRVATAEASKHSISPADDDSRTAIYDIAARIRIADRSSPVRLL